MLVYCTHTWILTCMYVNIYIYIQIFTTKRKGLLCGPSGLGWETDSVVATSNFQFFKMCVRKLRKTNPTCAVVTMLLKCSVQDHGNSHSCLHFDRAVSSCPMPQMCYLRTLAVFLDATVETAKLSKQRRYCTKS